LSDKRYAEDNSDRVSKIHKEWRGKNKDKIRERLNYKYRNDMSYRIILCLRNRQNRVLRGDYSTTNGLGCDRKKFLEWIERNFSNGMNWEK
jgi:hypothetical protein